MTNSIKRRGRVSSLIEANARVCLITLSVFTAALPIVIACGLLAIAARSEYRDVPDTCWFSRVAATSAVRESNPNAWQSLENRTQLTRDVGAGDGVVTLRIETPQELAFWERQLQVTGGGCYSEWAILE